MREDYFFVGSYTQGSASRGIHTVAMDPVTGGIRLAGSAGSDVNPSFLTRHGDFLYSVSEREGQGALVSYRIEKGGKLMFVDRFRTDGSDTCHITLSPNGRHAYAANYSSGSVFGVEVDAQGRFAGQTAFIRQSGIGPYPGRQEGPHAHFVSFLPDGRYLLCCDLGADRVFAYRYNDQDGSLHPEKEMDIPLPAGFGPRHFACSRDGERLYITGELSSKAAYYRRRAKAERIEEKSTLPEGFKGSSWASHIQLSVKGEFLYAANRGHDTIIVFPIDRASGRMGQARHYPCGGHWPRHFAISPRGGYLIVANQYSGDVTAWRLNERDGGLEEMSGKLFVPSPACITFG